MKKPKPPEGWEYFQNPFNGDDGVIHKMTGRWFSGIDKLKAMGNYFLAVAAWSEEKRELQLSERKKEPVHGRGAKTVSRRTRQRSR